MNTPNKLTILRIILVPLFVFFLLVSTVPNNLLIAGIIFVIASLTDHLDGELARKTNQITNFGKFLDPLADKILVISAYVCFIQLGIIGAVPVIIILMREFMVTSVRLVAVESGKVIAANIWGKAKTVSQIIAVIVIIFLKYFLILVDNNILRFSDAVSFANIFFIVSQVVVWISVLLTAVSGFIYIRDNINFIKPSHNM
ncbi:MAG: CDP-diacylglycerol--glycerol-3-phosphate 3-phosphatidyltransferase [Eubacteriales bacterium SKADARSKE-1]|nr:CDP-diacylglycerol--glycerol-3-phosphate 3-phosphatidyltransferase [Eubacteriales bacterium SKADARSKE-1]